MLEDDRVVLCWWIVFEEYEMNEMILLFVLTL